MDINSSVETVFVSSKIDGHAAVDLAKKEGRVLELSKCSSYFDAVK